MSEENEVLEALDAVAATIAPVLNILNKEAQVQFLIEVRNVVEDLANDFIGEYNGDE